MSRDMIVSFFSNSGSGWQRSLLWSVLCVSRVAASTDKLQVSSQLHERLDEMFSLAWTQIWKQNKTSWWWTCEVRFFAWIRCWIRILKVVTVIKGLIKVIQFTANKSRQSKEVFAETSSSPEHLKMGQKLKILIFVFLSFLLWASSDRNQTSSTAIISYAIYSWLSNW